MTTTLTSPSKSQIRDYLARRVNEQTPPPSMVDIRRQLGWELVPATVPASYKR
jgi:hypothetical protein